MLLDDSYFAELGQAIPLHKVKKVQLEINLQARVGSAVLLCLQPYLFDAAEVIVVHTEVEGRQWLL